MLNFCINRYHEHFFLQYAKHYHDILEISWKQRPHEWICVKLRILPTIVTLYVPESSLLTLYLTVILNHWSNLFIVSMHVIYLRYVIQICFLCVFFLPQVNLRYRLGHFTKDITSKCSLTLITFGFIAASQIYRSSTSAWVWTKGHVYTIHWTYFVNNAMFTTHGFEDFYFLVNCFCFTLCFWI